MHTYNMDMYCIILYRIYCIHLFIYFLFFFLSLSLSLSIRRLSDNDGTTDVDIKNSNNNNNNKPISVINQKPAFITKKESNENGGGGGGEAGGIGSELQKQTNGTDLQSPPPPVRVLVLSKEEQKDPHDTMHIRRGARIFAALEATILGVGGILRGITTSSFNTSSSSKAKPPPSLYDIPALLQIIRQQQSLQTDKHKQEQEQADALYRIYQLCDVGHKHNREVLINSTKWNVLSPLITCLSQESGRARRFTCIILNNLSIPTENKRTMALGPLSKQLIDALCHVIAQNSPQDSYLCCICLMNLSFLEPTITAILCHSKDGNKQNILPVDNNHNPSSLLCLLENILINSSSSTNSETARWTCGLLKNLTRSEENVAIIGQTRIPECIIENIRSSTTPPSRWSVNSLEDFSLFVIMNLARWPNSKELLIKLGALDTAKSIMIEENDLQTLKSVMISAFLGAEWSSFPPASGESVSELISNILEKKGKNGQYTHGTFKLDAALKAYHDLVVSSNVHNDTTDGSASKTNILAVPSTVALLFQILSDFILSAVNDAHHNDASETDLIKYASDAISAEYAVKTLKEMLTAILQTLVSGDKKEKNHDTTRNKSAQSTLVACKEISQMLLTYSEIRGTSEQSKANAIELSEKILSSSEDAAATSESVLMMSHNIWIQYRKRQGQPLDRFIDESE